MYPGNASEAIAEVAAFLGRAAVQRPGAGELGAQPGAAANTVRNDALVERGMKEEVVIVAIGAGKGVIGLPVAIGGIGISLGAVFLIGADFISGVAFLGGEHIDSLEKFSCRRL
jgi:hypothetical protein